MLYNQVTFYGTMTSIIDPQLINLTTYLSQNLKNKICFSHAALYKGGTYFMNYH